jgi:signal recognition particle receptor subunit beta
MSEIKIIFTGPTGAGKTTAVGCLSDIAPLRTDVANSDRGEADKDLTTVALDYGEVSLESGQKLKLFGTPGQARFSFVRRMLCRNALGAVVLIDDSRPDPCADLLEQVAGLEELTMAGRVVVGVGRIAANVADGTARYAAALAQKQLSLPVLSVDVRRPEDVLLLIDLLMNQLELDENFP